MSKKVLTGYNYAAVSAAPATIKDANGITLCEVKVGQIAYFTATTDIVDCGTDDVHVVQIRSNYTVSSTGGGGGVDPTPYLQRIAELEGLIDAIEQVIAALEADITAKRTQIAELQGQLAELQAELAELQAIMDDNRGRIIGINDAGSAVQMGQYLTQGGLFYQRQDIGEWYGSLPALRDNRDSSYHGFFQESSITGFHGELPALTNGVSMFLGSDLGSFETDIPQTCQDAQQMFKNCTSLTSFTGDLHSNRLQCQNMFEGCTSLKTLWPDYAGQEFPWSLRNVNYMFLNCSSLESFPFTLGSGYGICTGMFQGCSKLQWTTPLPSALYSAVGFFSGCKLNKASIEAIIASPLRSRYSNNITIGIDSTLITQEEQDAYNTRLVNERWTVTWERN